MKKSLIVMIIEKLQLTLYVFNWIVYVIEFSYEFLSYGNIFVEILGGTFKNLNSSVIIVYDVMLRSNHNVVMSSVSSCAITCHWISCKNHKSISLLFCFECSTSTRNLKGSTKKCSFRFKFNIFKFWITANIFRLELSFWCW